MKRLFVLLGLCAIFSLSSARAQTAEDQYLSIFSIIQQGDDFNESNKPKEALNSYLEAETALQKFQKAFPGWNKDIVVFRTGYLATQIADIRTRIEKPVVASPSPAPPEAKAPSASDALQNQIRSLQNQISVLQGENQILEAKLKESFAAKPADADPRALAKAQEDVRTLQKENELLKTSLAAAQASSAKPADAKTVEQLKQQLAQSNLKLNEAADKAAKLQDALSKEVTAAQEKLKTLQLENNLLKTDMSRAVNNSAQPGNAQIVEQLKQQLADSNAKLAEATERTAKLAAERQPALVVKPPVQSDADVEKLRAENDAIKRQLADLQTVVARPASPEDAARQLAQARAELALLQSDAEILQLEKTALANRAAYFAATSTNAEVATPVTADAELRAKLLAKQRELNQAKLDAIKSQNPPAKPTAPVTTASAPKPVNASTPTAAPNAATKPPEQIAMVQSPVAVPADPVAPPKEPSPENRRLLADARQAFIVRDFDKARANYLQVLQSDPDNFFVLGNLAAIELEQNRLDEADTHIQRAVSLAPNDAFNFSVLGNLKFKQQKFDDALTALNRAAQLDPTNAVVQNYLGVVLSQKGQRAQAESAYRKAIELNPNYAEAQNNLAVSYLTQQPPFIELARWHYQKAIALKFPRNPEIENLLDPKKPEPGAP